MNVINLPVNLNLNFRSKFKLNLLCRLEQPRPSGSGTAAQTAKFERVSTTLARRVTQLSSQWARLTQASRCAAAQTASVELQLELSARPGKLRAKLTLAFTGIYRTESGKSP